MTALLTTAAVAERLGVTRRSVTILARRHGIGANVGGSAGFRFREDDVDRLLSALTPSPAKDLGRRRGRR